MLDSLKFVKGAVSKKDLVPELTHFHIHDGRIEGYNGKMSLSAPIPLDIDCCPKAEPFIRAIEACRDTAQLHLTPAQRLSIRSGKFKALVETIPAETFPGVQPEGQVVPLDGIKLLPMLELLEPLIGADASRPWANGVLLDGESAFATNNVILLEYYMGCHFPYKVVLPRYAVREMLRIGEDPTHMQLTALSATFHYEGERWMRSQLVQEDWPNVRAMLDEHASSRTGMEVNEEFWEGLELLGPFTGEWGRINLRGSTLATHEIEDGQGATVDIDSAGLNLQGSYNHKMLSLLRPVAQRIDFSAYPGKVSWYGGPMRGLIMPMRPIGAETK